MKRLSITSKARSDIAGAAEFISKDSPAAAERFIDSVEFSLKMIRQSPLIGRKSGIRNDVDIRIWPVSGFERFLLFYLVGKLEIRLLRVIHSSRDYGSMVC